MTWGLFDMVVVIQVPDSSSNSVYIADALASPTWFSASGLSPVGAAEEHSEEAGFRKP